MNSKLKKKKIQQLFGTGIPHHILKVLPELSTEIIEKQSSKNLKKTVSHKEVGDTLGVNSVYVRLILDDGFRFIFKRVYVKDCVILNYMLSQENQCYPQAELRIPGYSSGTIAWAVIFLMYKHYYEYGPLQLVPSKDFIVPCNLALELYLFAQSYIM